MDQQILRLHQEDNVAMAVVDLSPGDVVEVGGKIVTIRQPIPKGHKVALAPIRAGGVVRKYGQTIGRATRDIAPGEHVHVHNLESARGKEGLSEPALTEPILAFRPPELSAGANFFGYRRPDGRVGVRNHVLVMAGTHCANGVVERIGEAVPEAIALPHIYGCSQLGEDLERTRQVLSAYVSHPNVAAALLVGLGCESLPTCEVVEELRSHGFRVESLLIQQIGGSKAAVEQGARIVRELLFQVAKEERVLVPVAKLVVGVECGGSDAWSGITANPAVGVAADILVAFGGTVILSEITEFIGAEHLLVAQTVDNLVRERILRAVGQREAMAKGMNVDIRGAQPSPGNMVGGLTTIEEKSLGAITKGGTAPIMEFLPYGRPPTAKGLVVMDTSGNDLESVTAMVAGGAQLILFTTGRGTPVGNPIAPVIKVASNTEVYERMRDDIDLNAGLVVEGKTILEVGQLIFQYLLQVANGQLACAERWGHREFAIEPLGPRI